MEMNGRFNMLTGAMKTLRGTKLDNPVVRFKVGILEKAMPAESAVVFGDIWKVDGFYTQKTLELGCKRALLVDSLETENWLNARLENPHLDFFKGDFSDPLFMKSIRDKFDIGVAFDIFLHQPPLLSTINLMLEKVDKRFCVVQPMLREQMCPNSLVYLPGNSDQLYPLGSRDSEFKMFDVSQVNQSHWIWGMTQSFLHAVFRGEGFDLVSEEELCSLPNPRWFWGGYIYERKRKNPSHWSISKVTPGLYEGNW
jgi:hypothetical protein